jgi:hypothetical protein
MHSLGRIALAMLFPNHYQALIDSCNETGESLREQERRIFPTSHTEVMAHLLATWRIPPDVFVPLKFSLDDFSALARLSEPVRSKTELVKLAVLLGRIAVNRWPDWDLVQLPGPRVLNRLGIRNVAEIVCHTRSDLSKIADFHPGGAPASQKFELQPTEQQVAYVNASGNKEDLLAELLPALGLQPKPLAADCLGQCDGPAIMNCLGVSVHRIAIDGRPNSMLFVADHEHREAFEALGQMVALPASMGQLRNAVRDCIMDQATEHVVATAP